MAKHQKKKRKETKRMLKKKKIEKDGEQPRRSHLIAS